MPYCEIIRFNNKTGLREYKIKVFGSPSLAHAICGGLHVGVEPKQKQSAYGVSKFSKISAEETHLYTFSKFSLAILIWRV